MKVFNLYWCLSEWQVDTERTVRRTTGRGVPWCGTTSITDAVLPGNLFMMLAFRSALNSTKNIVYCAWDKNHALSTTNPDEMGKTTGQSVYKPICEINQLIHENATHYVHLPFMIHDRNGPTCPVLCPKEGRKWEEGTSAMVIICGPGSEVGSASGKGWFSILGAVVLRDRFKCI